MTNTHRLRIRLQNHNYKAVLAEAERRGTDPSQVIDEAIEATRFTRLTGAQVYGTVLAMKTLLQRILAKARIQGVDLEGMGLPVAALDEKLTALHALLLEANGVDLSGRPQGESVEPMTLAQELRLEIEQERWQTLDQDHAG
ncbi:hypothetical protein GFS31_44100 (plasmid) [Leptolyngbya sp. BL0902]|uniref:hypothetical protein n=1 Tax=Leptolyngbya sp. BL0902 TaxID=1115757 RepID=UPI0018E7D0E0|nr:hypothetical protein [Leptolyngbya sp. BL0902]QQE67697.1 hypothetical protein GFS31_44100 [Leptolyngbya sp. BL0902]